MAVLWVMLLALACSLSDAAADHYLVPPARLAPSPYPEWAHYHWVWLDNSRANQASMIEYAKEYLAHNISVGAVDIDSGWSTGFNNFIFDTKKYPNASSMVSWFHSKNIRVILWVTSMVDTDSSNFQEAENNGYFIREVTGKQALLKWWHGQGGLLDYSNAAAVDWWHKQIDKVLELGIDGWKCDGTDPYILEVADAQGKGGHISRKEYSDAYYNDFFDYTRQARSTNDTLIMSRPVDGYGPIFLDFSPKHVMLSGWVGDQDPTFEGLKDALKRYLQSAWAGYANFGSDIGGYRSGNGTLGRSKELFIRWFQLGAFSPLMENGGNKEHRPWMFDNTNETLKIYQKYEDIHAQLVPYFLTIGSYAYDHGTSAIRPLAKHESWLNKLIDLFKPDTYNYLLGDSILVAPVLSHPSDVSVTFPEGQWVAWWNDSLVYKEGEVAKFTALPLEVFPAFIKASNILALRITARTPLLGDIPALHGALRLLLMNPEETAKPRETVVREDGGHGLIATHWLDGSGALRITVTAHSSLTAVVHLQGCLVGGSPPMATLPSVGADRAVPLQRVSGVDGLPRGGVFTELPAHTTGRSSLLINPGSLKEGVILTIHCK